MNTTLYYSVQSAPAVSVPTLSFSMLVFAALMLAVVGFVAIRRNPKLNFKTVHTLALIWRQVLCT